MSKLLANTIPFYHVLTIFVIHDGKLMYTISAWLYLNVHQIFTLHFDSFDETFKYVRFLHLLLSVSPLILTSKLINASQVNEIQSTMGLDLVWILAHLYMISMA